MLLPCDFKSHFSRHFQDKTENQIGKTYRKGLFYPRLNDISSLNEYLLKKWQFHASLHCPKNGGTSCSSRRRARALRKGFQIELAVMFHCAVAVVTCPLLLHQSAHVDRAQADQIDWEDKWLWYLMAFHIACFLLTFCTYNYSTIQAVLFFSFLAVVYFSEYINEYAATHWRLFSEQQYFDSAGLFISVLLSAPLLINCMIIAVMWMYQAWNLMIKAKRYQLQHQAAQEKANEKKKES